MRLVYHETIGKKKRIVQQYAGKILEKYNERMSYYIDNFKCTPSNQVRLIIFGQGRTGSTLLESLLCSTGYFRQNGELLNTEFKGEIQYPLRYIRGLSKRRTKENFVFHTKIHQLTSNRKCPIDPAMFLNSLYMDGWKIVYLRRKNKVRQVLSNFVATHRGKYHKLTNNHEKFSISINCKKFVKKVDRRLLLEDAEKKAIANIKYHEVVYEDDLEKQESHQRTIDNILEYVSLERQVASTRYKKINTQLLQDLIVNYDEFVNCLNKQGWQEYIN